MFISLIILLIILIASRRSVVVSGTQIKTSSRANSTPDEDDNDPLIIEWRDPNSVADDNDPNSTPDEEKFDNPLIVCSEEFAYLLSSEEVEDLEKVKVVEDLEWNSYLKIGVSI